MSMEEAKNKIRYLGVWLENPDVIRAYSKGKGMPAFAKEVKAKLDEISKELGMHVATPAPVKVTVSFTVPPGASIEAAKEVTKAATKYATSAVEVSKA